MFKLKNWCPGYPRCRSQTGSALPSQGVTFAVWLALSAIPTAKYILALSETQTIIWATIFLSSMVSSVVGFAFSAIAGAVLFQIDSDYTHAVETMLVASISLQSYSVFHLRKNISIKALLPFLAGGVVTIPVGAYLATHTKPQLILVMVGVFLCFYGLYSLSRPSLRVRSFGTAGDICAGALGGISGPVAAIPGPFVTIWCGMKGWDKSGQRGVAQPYILIMQIITFVALLPHNTGSVTVDWHLFEYMAPAVAGAFVGLKSFERLNDRQFMSVVAVFLIVSGIALIAKAL